ncbi:MAG: lipopolysaccharide heptosyltransferase I [Candidatus Koribacter versatilis]|uniref:Lipopolysaccharide heptosyltransferase 1 n=1 Tax=Candidatus Korobacter versatilis TaxID=658062 RepID=A0A932A7N3_9BACT|nr:lipopolysaccharide heptosyltransferase I [Candidatus Koribacter versatilis]
MKRILIVRLGAMGDVVHALPAATALRAALPDAHIGWAIEARWAPLLCAEGSVARGPNMPLVDAIHFVNTRGWRAAPWSDETWSEVRGTFRALRAARYDCALDFQGAMKSAAVAAFSGAAQRIGNARPWERVAAMFYTHPVEVHAAHVVEQALEAASAVSGQHLHYMPPALPQDAAAEQWAEQELARRGVRGFALLHPGAGWGAKQWPAARYGEVARALAARGVTPLINHGPDEQALAQEVARASNGSASAVQCSLSELIALTRRAALAIGGDTGPLHLAAALEVPIVALYGPTDPRRTGPFGTRAIVLRSEASTTSHARRAATEAGLLTIPAEQVIAAAQSLLGTGVEKNVRA